MNKFLAAGAILLAMVLNTESFASAINRAHHGDYSKGATPMQVFNSYSYSNLKGKYHE